jgi:hypothetical protein
MHPHDGCRKGRRTLTRHFERSYVEPQAIASAYEFACPICRRRIVSRKVAPGSSRPVRARAAASAAQGG